MSTPDFTRGQSVKVQTAHNHIPADDTIYQIGSLDRISGDISAVLLKDGKCIGSIPQIKLRASK